MILYDVSSYEGTGFKPRQGFWVNASRDLQYFSVNLGLFNHKVWVFIGWGRRWKR